MTPRFLDYHMCFFCLQMFSVKVARVGKLVHKPLEIGGPGGAMYLPLLVTTPHTAWSTSSEGNVNFLGTKSLVLRLC